MDYISTQPAKDTFVMFFQWKHIELGASPVAHLIKNPPVSAGDIRDVGSIPGSGRSSGGGHGNPLHNASLENPMDRGA